MLLLTRASTVEMIGYVPRQWLVKDHWTGTEVTTTETVKMSIIGKCFAYKLNLTQATCSST